MFSAAERLFELRDHVVRAGCFGGWPEVYFFGFTFAKAGEVLKTPCNRVGKRAIRDTHGALSQKKTPALAGVSLMGDTGLEPVTSALSRRRSPS